MLPCFGAGKALPGFSGRLLADPIRLHGQPKDGADHAKDVAGADRRAFGDVNQVIGLNLEFSGAEQAIGAGQINGENAAYIPRAGAIAADWRQRNSRCAGSARKRWIVFGFAAKPEGCNPNYLPINICPLICSPAAG